MAFDKIEDEARGGPKFTTTTKWTGALGVFAAARGSREALEVLCCKYQYPVYAFFRRSEGNAEVARDLTQGFFVKLLEKNYVADADRARGRFRTFLFTSASHYLSNERKHRHTQKEGGGQRFVSLDQGSAEDRYQNEPGHDLTPEVLYEHHFALALIAQGLSTVRARYEKAGKVEVFESLKGFLDGSDSRPHAVVAVQLGWTAENVRVAVHRLRKLHCDVVRAEIAETLGDPGDVEVERRHLITALRTPRKPGKPSTP
jgi:RNA polymerase sigma-70 factor (ECF subfamily)